MSDFIPVGVLVGGRGLSAHYLSGQEAKENLSSGGTDKKTIFSEDRLECLILV